MLEIRLAGVLIWGTVGVIITGPPQYGLHGRIYNNYYHGNADFYCFL